MIRILLLFLLIRTSYPSTTSTFKLVRIFHKSTSLYNNTFKTTHIQNPHTFTIKHLPIPPRFQTQRNKLNNQFPLNTAFQRHPDITDKQTILNMAQMTANAYSTPSIEKWVDVPGWNVSTRFGWESDGLRGYVYSDSLAEVFVIVIKGTSAGIFEGTGVRDLYNDNVVNKNNGNIKGLWNRCFHVVVRIHYDILFVLVLLLPHNVHQLVWSRHRIFPIRIIILLRQYMLRSRQCIRKLRFGLRDIVWAGVLLR